MWIFLRSEPSAIAAWCPIRNDYYSFLRPKLGGARDGQTLHKRLYHVGKAARPQCRSSSSGIDILNYCGKVIHRIRLNYITHLMKADVPLSQGRTSQKFSSIVECSLSSARHLPGSTKIICRVEGEEGEDITISSTNKVIFTAYPTRSTSAAPCQISAPFSLRGQGLSVPRFPCSFHPHPQTRSELGPGPLL